MYSKILVPLDGSPIAEQVLPYARLLAGKLMIPVELLAVLDLDQIAAHLTSTKARHFDTAIADINQHLTSYLQNISGTFPSGPVQCSVKQGRPQDVIVEEAAADKSVLLMMASHGRSGLNRFLLGSVAEKVLRATLNPLLLIRASEDGKTAGVATFKSIIVPLDGSELAEKVLPAVASLSKQLASGVVLFRAYQTPYAAYGNEVFYALHQDELLTDARDQAQRYLDGKADELRTGGAANVSCAAEEGFGADQIIALSHRTPDNLIVRGSHGRSGLHRWMLGSVAEAVARYSGEPVLIIRVAG
jgi:nucleotide-binding universal stress UspA family protein